MISICYIYLFIILYYIKAIIFTELNKSHHFINTFLLYSCICKTQLQYNNREIKTILTPKHT